MRSKIFAAYFIVFAVHVSSAQSGWIMQSPPPFQYTFMDVHLFDKNNIMVIGSEGAIRKTTNGGSNWTSIESGTKSNLQAVCFIDPDTAWVVGSSSTILKSTNRGETWAPITSDLPTYLTLKDVFFKDSKTGLLLSDGAIYKTVDGGAHWQSKLKTASMTFLESFDFYDANTGIAVGSSGTGKVFRTTNGGDDWSASDVGGASWVYASCMIDAKNCWAAGLRASRITISSDMWTGTSITIESPIYTLWSSTNGGENWTQKNLSYSGRIYGIEFLDNRIGFAVGEQGLVLRTEDGGSNWNGIKSAHNMYQICFSGKSAGFAVGAKGTLMSSTDGGDAWKLLSGSGTTNNLASVFFLNENVGLAVGLSGTIMHTTTGGALWSDYYISLNSTSTHWYSVCFPDSSTGFLLGDGFNNILKTINSGKNWNWNERQSSWNINDSFFINPSKGWLAGDQGVIAVRNGKSQNNYWTPQTSGTTYNLFSIFFVDTLNGWAVGQASTVLHTTDGGNKWSSMAAGLPKDLTSGSAMNSVYFIDPLRGFIACTNGIIRTVDGGTTWFNACDFSPVFDLAFADGATGWAVGSSGIILRTNDAGLTWGLQKSGTSEHLESVFCANDKTVYIAGYKGVIIKTTNGGGDVIYPPTAPVITWPGNKSINNSVNLTMTWQTSANATSYRLQVSQDSSFSSLKLDCREIKATQFTLVELDGQKEYFFRVKACYEDKMSSPWSTVNRFKTGTAVTQDPIWVQINKNYYDYRDVFFINSSTGWAVSNYGISKTTDAGNAWNISAVEAFGSQVSLQKVRFIDQSSGWVSGDSLLFHSSNGGSSWQQIYNVGKYHSFGDFSFINQTSGWAIIDSRLYKTTNGGLEWKKQMDDSFVKIYFLNENTGWVAGYGGLVCMTTTGGSTWRRQNSGISNVNIDAFFIDENNGWVAQANSIMRTTNQGDNWTLQASFEGVTIKKIFFFNSNIGWVLGNNYNTYPYHSTVITTTDGGSTWALHELKDGTNLNSIFFIDDKKGWAVGDGIWKTTIGGVRTTGVDETASGYGKRPGSYGLLQNYPNPFNNSTVISFELPEEGRMTLKIYNMLGQEVKTLFDGIRNAGKHNEAYSFNDLPSGIYFYQICIGEHILTRKFILMR